MKIVSLLFITVSFTLLGTKTKIQREIYKLRMFCYLLDIYDKQATATVAMATKKKLHKME